MRKRVIGDRRGVIVKSLNKVLNGLRDVGTVQNIFVRVGSGENIIYDACFGNVNDETLFDMASVTKIMATTSLALIAMDKGLIRLDTPVNEFFETKKPITVKNLLTHTIGIGHKNLCADGNSYPNIAEKILEIPQDSEIGNHVIYSCPGFILLGKILEKAFGDQLDKLFNKYVASTLGLTGTSFLPVKTDNCVNSNPGKEDKGIVNDYNCRFLGGVAGNAGLFSNVNDVTKYVRCLLKRGEPIIRKETFELATTNYTPDMEESRGLGFVYVDKRYDQTGGLFADGAIGHCGHTGQSVFLDYRTGLYVIVLSDATVSTIKKYGYERYDEVTAMRKTIHSAIKTDLFG